MNDIYGMDSDMTEDRTATEAEAHAEWHLNAGVPVLEGRS
jgi:hypothetical protein